MTFFSFFAISIQPNVLEIIYFKHIVFITISYIYTTCRDVAQTRHQNSVKYFLRHLSKAINVIQAYTSADIVLLDECSQTVC